jgi:hypothetical protein
MQIAAFLAFVLGTSVYGIFQYGQIAQGSLSGYLIAIPVVCALFGVIYIMLSVKLYKEFGWKMFKKIGADPVMKVMFRDYQILLLITKFDVFFVLAFGIQFLVLVIKVT